MARMVKIDDHIINVEQIRYIFDNTVPKHKDTGPHAITICFGESGDCDLLLTGDQAKRFWDFIDQGVETIV